MKHLQKNQLFLVISFLISGIMINLFLRCLDINMRIKVDIPAFNEKLEDNINTPGILNEVQASFNTDYLYNVIDKPLQPKEVFLTFDDGPSPNNTLKILDILEKNQVKATFFVVGRKAEENSNILRKINEKGMCIATHTYSHEYGIYREKETYFSDLEKCNNTIYKIIGKRPERYIRLPGGSDNLVSNPVVLRNIKNILREKGINYVDWNICAQDAESNVVSMNEIRNNIINQCSGASFAVILMHDTYYKASTVQALPYIIKYLKEQNFTFRTFDDITPSEYNQMARLKIMNR